MRNVGGELKVEKKGKACFTSGEQGPEKDPAGGCWSA